MKQAKEVKTVGILQPSYLPWMGYFDQINRCDIFVLYDDVAFDKHGWRNRNRINSITGPLWLTVPVKHKGLFGQLIKDVRIDLNTNYFMKHLSSIRQFYSRSHNFDWVMQAILPVYMKKWSFLIDLNVALIDRICTMLNIKKKWILSSELSVEGEQSSRLLRICQHFSATHYLTGNAAQNYLDTRLFDRFDITVCWHNYEHPYYIQYHQPHRFVEFIPYLSVIDLLLSCGESSREFYINECKQ